MKCERIKFHAWLAFHCLAIQFVFFDQGRGSAQTQELRRFDGCLQSIETEPLRNRLSSLAINLEDTVHALAIYVAFPDQESQQLPPYYQEVEFLMHDFFAEMSNGRHQLFVSTVRRPPPNESLAYVADSTYAFYYNTPDSVLSDGREFLLTENIFQKIQRDHPALFDTVDVVFFNILAEDFVRGSTGIAQLFLTHDARAIYNGPGTTQDIYDENVFKGLLAHEYGHLLGFTHPPDHFLVHFGDYEIMDRFVQRLAPFSVENLWRNGWLDPSRVIRLVGQHKNVVIGDIRRGGLAYQLPISKNEYFWLVNHQRSDYDSNYLGKGLLIWHIKKEDVEEPEKLGSLWDIESAAGLFNAEGLPDPIAGLDSFDLDLFYSGSAGNFFNETTQSSFTPESNPNTNGYVGQFKFTPQTIVSGVRVENIRTVGTDIIADIFVPNDPPEILSVTQHPDTYDSQKGYRILAHIKDDLSPATATLFYRTRNADAFQQIPMLGHHAYFQVEVPPQPEASAIEYYLTAMDETGLIAVWPSAAPDSLLSFVITSQLPKIDLWPKNQTINMHSNDTRSMAWWIGNRGKKNLEYFISSSEIVVHKRKHGFGAEFLPPSDTLHTWVHLHIHASPAAPIVDGIFNNEEWRDASVLHLIDEENGELLAAAKIYFKTVDKNIFAFVDPYKIFPETEPQDGKTYAAVFFFMSDSEILLKQFRVRRSDLGVELPRGVSLSATIDNSEPHLVFETEVALDSLRRLSSNYFLFAPEFQIWHPNGSGKVIRWPYLDGHQSAARIFFESGFPLLETQFEPATLKPGEFHQQDLIFRTTAADSNKTFFGQINVYSNDPAQPIVTLPVIVDTRPAALPTEFVLAPVYPNPFNPTTTIQFQLPSDARVSLKVYNVLGQLVREIYSGELRAGTHHFIWDGRDNDGRGAATGVYFAAVNALGQQKVRKMLLLR